ncbi:MAG: hypothetical protein AB7T63_11905 [Planctomycetota bacterium]
MLAVWRHERRWLLAFYVLLAVIFSVAIEKRDGDSIWIPGLVRGEEPLRQLVVWCGLALGLYAGLRDHLGASRAWFLHRAVSRWRLDAARVLGAVLVLSAAIGTAYLLSWFGILDRYVNRTLWTTEGFGVQLALYAGALPVLVLGYWAMAYNNGGRDGLGGISVVQGLLGFVLIYQADALTDPGTWGLLPEIPSRLGWGPDTSWSSWLVAHVPATWYVGSQAGIAALLWLTLMSLAPLGYDADVGRSMRRSHVSSVVIVLAGLAWGATLVATLQRRELGRLLTRYPHIVLVGDHDAALAELVQDDVEGAQRVMHLLDSSHEVVEPIPSSDTEWLTVAYPSRVGADRLGTDPKLSAWGESRPGPILSAGARSGRLAAQNGRVKLIWQPGRVAYSAIRMEDVSSMIVRERGGPAQPPAKLVVLRGPEGNPLDQSWWPVDEIGSRGDVWVFFQPATGSILVRDAAGLMDDGRLDPLRDGEGRPVLARDLFKAPRTLAASRDEVRRVPRVLFLDTTEGWMAWSPESGIEIVEDPPDRRGDGRALHGWSRTTEGEDPLGFRLRVTRPDGTVAIDHTYVPRRPQEVDAADAVQRAALATPPLVALAARFRLPPRDVLWQPLIASGNHDGLLFGVLGIALVCAFVAWLRMRRLEMPRSLRRFWIGSVLLGGPAVLLMNLLVVTRRAWRSELTSAPGGSLPKLLRVPRTRLGRETSP